MTRPRAVLLAMGLLLLAIAWLALAPHRWLGRLIPLDTPGTQFNLSLLGEVRTSLALLGLTCLLIATLGPRLLPLTDRLTSSIALTDRWLRAGHRWPLILLACTALAGLILAAYSITRHSHFNSKAYDLGLHAQVFWNSSQGRLFASSIEVDNYLGDHVSPIILLLLPIYWLWPDPRALLVLQAVSLSLGALPVAWLARYKLRPYWPEAAHVVALFLALIYLAYPALGFVNRFEFHEEVWVVPLLLLAFWFLERERPVAMSLALLLALLCKEDVGLTVAAFGLFAWWRSRRSAARSSRIRPALGLAWTAVGLTWSLVALFLVIPAFRGGAPSDTLGRYAWLGLGPAEVLIGLLRDPGSALDHVLGEPRRLWFLVKFLLPVGFLPLLSPAILIALPSLAVNWLAGNLYQSSIYFHYAATLIPVIFAATIYGVEQLARIDGVQQPASHGASQPGDMLPGHAPGDAAPGTRTSIRFLPLILLWLVACTILALAFDQPWQPEVGPQDWENYGLAQQVDPAAFWAASALLPSDGSVATSEAYAPHLANREGLYLLYDPRILRVVDRVDWVLVDLSDQRYGVTPRLYYGLLRWVADRRGLSPCHFAGDVVLLGPNCEDPAANAPYQARLAELQQSVASDELDPALVDALGARYFKSQE